jgi:hypothetical protein
MKRRVVAVCCAGLAALMLNGCSPNSGEVSKQDAAAAQKETSPENVTQDPPAPTGEAAPPATTSATPPPPELVTPGKIEAIFVSPNVISDLVGAKMGFEKEFSRPGSPAGGLGDKSGCAVLFGLNSDSYGREYTAFRRSSVRDGEDSPQHFAAQEAASYADAATAAQVFRKAIDGQALAVCNNAVVHRQGDDDRIKWQFEVQNVTGDAAQWTLLQQSDGKPNDWNCVHEARVKNNVVLGVTVCEYANGAPAATAIADRMSSWFPA